MIELDNIYPCRVANLDHGVFWIRSYAKVGSVCHAKIKFFRNPSLYSVPIRLQRLNSIFAWCA